VKSDSDNEESGEMKGEERKGTQDEGKRDTYQRRV